VLAREENALSDFREESRFAVIDAKAVGMRVNVARLSCGQREG
jgi:hypothetical protein